MERCCGVVGAKVYLLYVGERVNGGQVLIDVVLSRMLQLIAEINKNEPFHRKEEILKEISIVFI